MIIKLPKVICINKKEKVIRVKGTAKRKAHTRTIHFEGKEQKGEKIIRKFEDSIWQQPEETCGVFDSAGNTIFEKDGTKDRVTFNSEEMRQCEGMILTHNHPSGNSFSKLDIEFACKTKMREMRAIGSTNTRYSMKVHGRKNFSVGVLNRIIDSYNANYKVIQDRMVAEIKAGKLDYDTGNKTFYDVVWRAVSDANPDLNYSVDRSKEI